MGVMGYSFLVQKRKKQRKLISWLLFKNFVIYIGKNYFIKGMSNTKAISLRTCQRCVLYDQKFLPEISHSHRNNTKN